jgi:hypothetical protein
MGPKQSRCQLPIEEIDIQSPVIASVKTVFGWLIAILTAFIGLIWGDLTSKVSGLEIKGGDRDTRLSRVETHIEHVNKELGDLHADVGTINNKMDRLLDLIYRRDADSKRGTL